MAESSAAETTLEPARLKAALESIERGRGRWRPRLRLAFEPTLEREFLKHRAVSVLTLQRLAILLGAVLYGVYLVNDALNAQVYIDPLILMTLAVFTLPGYTLLIAISFVSEPWRYIFSVARISALLHTSGLLLICALSAADNERGMYEFLVLQLIYDFFLLGLVWSEANRLALLTVVAAPAVMFGMGQSLQEVFNYGFFVTATAALGSIGCHLQERAQRAAWLRGQLLLQMSERDPLTDLFNHRAFYSRGDQLIRHARREGHNVALLGVDIDYFKRFNDVYGHLAGDECLRQVAQIVADHARRPLDLAGRLGGEEFAVFLYDIKRSAALSRAEDLREAVKALQIPGKVRITISIGVATATPMDAITMEGMVGQADVALYRAKHDQRDCVREWSDSKSKTNLLLMSSPS
ncbi:MAG: diguanylate cyclase [Panacagrimonas sp.]